MSTLAGRCLGMALVAVGLLPPVGVRATQDDVSWTGASDPSDPSWAMADNWDPAAPDVTTAGMIKYGVAGQTLTGRLETDRTVGGVSITHPHALNLNGYRLMLNGNWTQTESQSQAFVVSNGVLRLGSAGNLVNLDLGQVNATSYPHLVLRPDVVLQPYLDKLRIGCDAGTGWNRPGGYLDLRGVQLDAAFGGLLSMNALVLRAGDRGTGYLYLDDSTGIVTLEVLDLFGIADHGRTSWSRIGNPNDGWRLPTGMNIKIGDEATERRAIAAVGIGCNHGTNSGELILNGGDFVAWLSELQVGRATTLHNTVGTLNLLNVGDLSIDTSTLTVGTTTGAGLNGRGTFHSGGGTITAGTVSFGNRPYDVSTYPYNDTGWANVIISNTTFTVTNSVWSGKNATIQIDVPDTSSGIDLTRNAMTWHLNEGSSVRINFHAEPDTEAFLHALKLKGDHLALLADMSMAGELTYRIDPGISGMKAGAFYSNTVDTTYFALVNEAFEFPPIFAVQDATYEVEDGGTVRVDVSELIVSAYDFEERPFHVAITYGAQVKVTELALSGIQAHSITVTMTIDDNGTPIEYDDISTVTLAAIAEATDSNDVTWSGAAKTVLMERPSWFWGANWEDGVPPAAITTGRVLYSDAGQTVTGGLDANRSIGGLYALGLAATHHTLNLGGHRLTVIGDWEQPRLSQSFTVSNGILQLGAPTHLIHIKIGRETGSGSKPLLTISPDVTLVPHIDTIRVGLDIGYSASHPGGRLDLRGVALDEAFAGLLRVNELSVRSGAGANAVGDIVLDNDTGIATLAVLDRFGVGLNGRDTTSRIGNPSDGWRLPLNMNLHIGDSVTDRRANAYIGLGSSHGTSTGEVFLNGGDLVAWLNTLHVGRATSNNRTVGILDLRTAGELTIDVHTLTVGTSTSTGRGDGTLRLGAGMVRAGFTTVVNADNPGEGLLTLSNTIFGVTNTLTVGSNGTVTVTLAGNPGGLILTRDDPGALAVDDGGVLEFHFNARSRTDQLYVGLTWKGEHVAILEALRDAVPARLVIHDGGMAPRTAQIYKYLGSTYVGQLPPAGSLLRLR